MWTMLDRRPQRPLASAKAGGGRMILLIIGLAVCLAILLGVAIFVWSLAKASRDDDAPGPFDD